MLSLVIKSMIIAAVIVGIWEITTTMIGLWVWSTIRKNVSDAEYDRIRNMDSNDQRDFLAQYFSKNL